MNVLRKPWIEKEIKSQLTFLERFRKTLPKDPSSRDTQARDFVADDGSLKVCMTGAKKYLQILEWTQWNSSRGFAVPAGPLHCEQVLLIAGNLSDRFHTITCEFTDDCVRKSETERGRRITEGTRGNTIQLVSYELVIKGCDAACFWEGVTFQSQSETLKPNNKPERQSSDHFLKWSSDSAPRVIFRVSDFQVVADLNDRQFGKPVPIMKCEDIMVRILALPRLADPWNTSLQEATGINKEVYGPLYLETARPTQVTIERDTSDDDHEQAEIFSQPASPDPAVAEEQAPGDGSNFRWDDEISEMQFATQLHPHLNLRSASPTEVRARLEASLEPGGSLKSAIANDNFQERMNDLTGEIFLKINKVRTDSAKQHPTNSCKNMNKAPQKSVQGYKEGSGHVKMLPLHPGWKGMREISEEDVKITREQRKILESSAWYIPTEHVQETCEPPPTTPVSSSSETYLTWSPTPPRDEMPPDSSAVQWHDSESPRSSQESDSEMCRANSKRSPSPPRHSQQLSDGKVSQQADEELTIDEPSTPGDSNLSCYKGQTTFPPMEGPGSDSESEVEVQPPMVNPRGHTAAQRFGILGSQNILLRKKRKEEKERRRLSGEPDTDDEAFVYKSPEPYDGETSSDELERNKQTQGKKTLDKRATSELAKHAWVRNLDYPVDAGDYSSCLPPVLATVDFGTSVPFLNPDSNISPKQVQHRLESKGACLLAQGDNDDEEDIPQVESIAFGRYQHRLNEKVNVDRSIKHEDSNDTDDNNAHEPKSTRGRRTSSNSSPSRPFDCEQCPQHFKRREHLKRHIDSIHKREKPFFCAICIKSFSRSDNFRQHMRTHKPDTESDTKSDGVFVGIDNWQINVATNCPSQRTNALADETDELIEDDNFITADEEQTQKASEAAEEAIPKSPSRTVALFHDETLQNGDKTFADSQSLLDGQFLSPICLGSAGMGIDLTSPQHDRGNKLLNSPSDGPKKTTSDMAYARNSIAKRGELCTQRGSGEPVVQVKETPYSLSKHQKTPIVHSSSETTIRGTPLFEQDQGNDSNPVNLSEKTNTPSKRKLPSSDQRCAGKKQKKQKNIAFRFDLSQDDQPVDLATLVQEQKMKALSLLNSEDDSKIARPGGVRPTVEHRVKGVAEAASPHLHKSASVLEVNSKAAASNTHPPSNAVAFSTNRVPRVPSINRTKKARASANANDGKAQATSVRLLGEILARESKKDKGKPPPTW